PKWSGTPRPGKRACGPSPTRRTPCWRRCGRWSRRSSCGRSSRPTGWWPTCFPARTFRPAWIRWPTTPRRARGLGHQYVAQRRLRSSESVSVLLFATALQLARNRGLFDPGEDLAKRRVAFLTELRDLLRRIDQIEDLALRRYARDASARATGP